MSWLALAEQMIWQKADGSDGKGSLMKRIERFIAALGRNQWREQRDLRKWSLQRSNYLAPEKYEHSSVATESDSLKSLNGGYGTTYFLSTDIYLPEDWHPAELALLYEGGGEGLLRVNGAPYHGLDRNHSFVPLPAIAPEQKVQLEIELYDPVPEPKDPLNRQAVIRPSIAGISVALVRVNHVVYSLLHTVKAVYESVRLLPPSDMRRIRLVKALERMIDSLEHGEEQALADDERVSVMERQLVELAAIEAANGERNGFIHLVGQSHIDLAWLWPLKETVRKVGRTFSTVCTLMEKYPEFRYSQSQPQLYAYVKRYYPELFERIKGYVKEGRWELVGGMWVEPDLNIPNGESLARQILYGQQFYGREFGKRTTIEWLPDTFGYCASLPQLLKQAGMPYFMTTKLGWNDTNKFPYTLFEWIGIDGTSVVAYQNHGVNESTSPKDLHEHWEDFGEKSEHSGLMLLYGHGDGGGGVTHEMLEAAERSNLMTGLPASRYSTAEAFFSELEEQRPELPVWHGDLYLELHRGTYTSQAYNKKSNRQAEMLYREAELWSEFAAWNGAAWNPEGLREGWELLLLNQFHDIVPGSSIPEVYETSQKQYGEVFRIGAQVLDSALQALDVQLKQRSEGVRPLEYMQNSSGEETTYLIFNSLGWEREELVWLEGDERLLGCSVFAGQSLLDSDVWVSDASLGKVTMVVAVPGIPAFGYRSIRIRKSEDQDSRQLEGQSALNLLAPAPFPDFWESEHYLLDFNDQGEIVRWYDKDYDRELLPEGEKGNQLLLFHDRPTLWDAWDIDPRYEQQPAGAPVLTQRCVIHSGQLMDILHFGWEYGSSVIEQQIILPKQGRRIDFRTKVQWNEDHKLLKVAFPVDVLADKATYEIPFGALERPTHRNTSWEQAQYEVCGHRFADVSERGYGVSLLNDCKYGYDIHGHVMRLSLLRAPSWPDLHADRGSHEFTYSLYPHAGDWREAQVVREASALNAPLRVKAGEPGAVYPELHCWMDFHSDHVILDTIKPAEDGGGSVLRLYESSGGRGDAILRGLSPGTRAYESSLLEEKLEQLHIEHGSLRLRFKPYEIKTIKIEQDTK